MRYMMKLMIFSLVVFCFFTSSAEEISTDPYSMRHGLTIFTGPKPTKGDGEYAKKKGIKPTNFKQNFNFLPNHYLTIQISQGRSDMPQWKDLLTPRQTQDLTEYIQTFRNK